MLKSEQLALLKKAALLKKEPKSRSKLEEYRMLIIFLHLNNYSKLSMVEYLNKNKIKVSYSTFHQYLKKNPLTEDEIAEGTRKLEKTKKEADDEINSKLEEMYGSN